MVCITEVAKLDPVRFSLALLAEIRSSSLSKNKLYVEAKGSLCTEATNQLGKYIHDQHMMAMDDNV
jgi:hypothetical protein